MPRSGYTVKLSKAATLIKTKMDFQDQLSLNAGQKYCRMLRGEHSAILSTCIMLQHGFKTFCSSIFERTLNTGFTVWTVHRTGYMHQGTEVIFLLDGGGRGI